MPLAHTSLSLCKNDAQIRVIELGYSLQLAQSLRLRLKDESLSSELNLQRV